MAEGNGNGNGDAVRYDHSVPILAGGCVAALVLLSVGSFFLEPRQWDLVKDVSGFLQITATALVGAMIRGGVQAKRVSLPPPS